MCYSGQNPKANGQRCNVGFNIARVLGVVWHDKDEARRFTIPHMSLRHKCAHFPSDECTNIRSYTKANQHSYTKVNRHSHMKASHNPHIRICRKPNGHSHAKANLHTPTCTKANQHRILQLARGVKNLRLQRQVKQVWTRQLLQRLAF